jgi:PIN domain nuclease of toxin-antitoxin system
VIVLDTHVWVWWLTTPRLLSKRAADAIADARAIGIPAIACFEVANAVARGRMTLDRPVRSWLEVALLPEKVELVPLDPGIAARAADLEIHGDPADRLIVATAALLDAALVTKDDLIRRSRLVVTIW